MTADGLSSAMDILGDRLGSPPDAPRAKQLPLMPTAGAADSDPGMMPGGDEPRGPGRPAGALNESTKVWREYLLKRYPSPLIVLAEIMSRPAHLLAAEMGMSREDALKAQMQAAHELLPYMHSKMPVAIELDQVNAAPLIFHVSAEMEVLIAQSAAASGLSGQMRVINQDADKSTGYEGADPEVGRTGVGKIANSDDKSDG